MNCNEIKREALELQMTIKNCKSLKTSQLNKMVELILALEECKCLCKDAQIGSEIYSFQFDNISDSISNIDLLTEEFLSMNGLSHTEDTLLFGKNIQFNKIGRIGFVIKNLEKDPYQILDLLNNNITSITFDYEYSDNISYFVSKEFITPSINYFKFIKN